MNTPIFLLHGLGAHPITLLPLELYLNFRGWKNTYKLSYPVDTLLFDDCVDYIDREMQKFVEKRDEVILIGQSMGGVVANNLHKKGWEIKHAIYIGSPLHGANLLNQLEKILPIFIVNSMYKLPYDYLKQMNKEKIPPRSYNTISMGWMYSEFDGCVYIGESMLEKDKHTHLQWADHRTVFANPRLWCLVDKLLVKAM